MLSSEYDIPTPCGSPIDLSIISTVSTMTKPRNEGMGCYINAPMIAMFGYFYSGKTWLTKALTKTNKNDTEFQVKIKHAIQKYVNDLRFGVDNGRNANPNTIRESISEININSGTLLEKEIRLHEASSASEFVSHLLDFLIHPENAPFQTQDERIEWNDAHASVVLDRCFCYSNGTELPCKNMSINILDNMIQIPGKCSTDIAQPSSYYSLSLSDADENSSSSLRDFVNYRTVSTIGRPAVDFYVFRNPYRVKGVDITKWNTRTEITIQEIYQVACDLLPSFQTGSMSQKLIHHIVQYDTNRINDNPAKKIIEWVARHLFISNDRNNYMWIVVACILVESCILLGDFESAWTHASRVSDLVGKCEYLEYIISKRNTLRDGATGTIYMFPGQIIGTFPKCEKPPRWIFATRTVIVGKSLPYLVVNVSPRKGRIFVPVDDPNTMELHVPIVHGDNTHETTMKLVGAVEYIPGSSIGHYIGWFWGKSNIHDEPPSWFTYDDLRRDRGYVSHNTESAMKRLSHRGVLFFYVPVCKDEVHCQDTNCTGDDIYALDKALAKKRTIETAKHTHQTFMTCALELNDDSIYQKQKALSYISKNKKIDWCVDILFNINDVNIVCESDKNIFSYIYDKAIHKMIKHWGMVWIPSELCFHIYDAPTFERMFVNDHNAYIHVGKILDSLKHHIMHNCTNKQCELYRNYTRELSIIISKELLTNSDPRVRTKVAFLRNILLFE